MQYKKSSGEKVKVCISAVLVENTEAREEKKKKNYPHLHLIPPAIPQQRDKPPPTVAENFFNSSAAVRVEKKKKTDSECLKLAEKARSQILFTSIGGTDAQKRRKRRDIPIRKCFIFSFIS